MSAYVRLPPRLDESQAVPPQLTDPKGRPVSLWRRLAMLGVMSGYILALVIQRGETTPTGPALPDNTADLLRGLIPQLGEFALVFAVAYWLGRPTRRELFANHGPTPLRWIFGFAWSLALRFGVGAIVAVTAVFFESWKGKSDPPNFEAYRPKVENLVDFRAMRDPIYLLTICTLVSFVLAGLREELWRACMICAGASVLPTVWSERTRQVLAVLVAALIFGAAHALQGAAGVALAGVLGLFLGLIMVIRRSLWEAVLAHGFFDAGSFFLLRVFSDQVLLEQLLTRAGVPSDLIRSFLDQLSQYFGK